MCVCLGVFFTWRVYSSSPSHENKQLWLILLRCIQELSAPRTAQSSKYSSRGVSLRASHCLPPRLTVNDQPSIPKLSARNKKKKRWAFIWPHPCRHILENSRKRSLQALLVVVLQQCGRDARSPAHLFFVDFWRVEQQARMGTRVKREIDAPRSKYCFKHIGGYSSSGGGGGKAASSLRKAFNKIGPVSEEITSYIVLHVCPDVCFSHYFK